MNSRGDSSTFRELYLRRFLWALKSIRKPSQGDGDEVAEVPRSSRNIKLAADVSLALTANRAAWSRALLNRISSDEINRPALKKILEPTKFQAIIAQRARHQSRLIYQSRLKHAHMQQQQHQNLHGLRGSKQSGLSLYRFFCFKRMKPASSSNARLCNRRTRQLQMLVPGGKSMDASCLLRETADYIRSLTIQVEVLQSLVNSVNDNQHPP